MRTKLSNCQISLFWKDLCTISYFTYYRLCIATYHNALKYRVHQVYTWKTSLLLLLLLSTEDRTLVMRWVNDLYVIIYKKKKIQSAPSAGSMST